MGQILISFYLIFSLDLPVCELSLFSGVDHVHTDGETTVYLRSMGLILGTAIIYLCSMGSLTSDIPSSIPLITRIAR